MWWLLIKEVKIRPVLVSIAKMNLKTLSKIDNNFINSNPKILYKIQIPFEITLARTAFPAALFQEYVASCE